MIRLSVFLICTFIPMLISAQAGLKFHHYRSTDGLSNDVIQCLFQDSRGFIWIGTEEGLNRFDGLEFRTYLHHESDTTSISGNRIRKIVEDRNGDLWIATYDGGLCRYDRNSGYFYKFYFKYENTKAENLSKVIEIAIRNNNELWVSFMYAPHCKIDLTNHEVTWFDIDDRFFFRNRSYEVFVSRDQKTYLGQFLYGLTIWDGSKWKLRNYGDVYPKPGGVITSIWEDENGLIWYGGWDNGLYTYNPESDELKTEYIIDNAPLVFSGEEIQALCQNGDYIWAGTRYTGLWTYNKHSGETYNYQIKAYDNYSIVDNNILSMLRDDDGRIWIGTNNGLSLYDPDLFQFDVVWLSGSAIETRSNEYVKCFYEDDSQLLIGTTRGLWTSDKSYDFFNFKELKYEGQALQIHSIFKTSGGQWLLGTNRSLMRWDRNNNLKLINTLHNPSVGGKTNFLNIVSSRINEITEYEYEGKNLIFASAFGYGLGCFDTETWSGFIYYHGNERAGPDECNNLEPMTRKMLVDSKGRFWLGGANNGVHCGFEVLLKNEFENALQDFGYAMYKDTYTIDSCIINYNIYFNNILPPGTDVFDILELDDGSFLCSTLGKGLWKIDPGLKQAVNINSLHKNLEGMETDSEGNIWIISSGGFDMYNSATGNWHRFDHRDGFPETGVNGYIFKDRNGKFYAGGTGYFISFYPKDISINTNKPKVVITGFSVFDKPADYLLSREEINLNYTQNNIKIEFSALNYTNPEMNQYAYRLLGYQDEWVQSGTVNFARFPQLPGGTYEFQVKASNNHGIWNEEFISIPIIISLPFWEELWFIVLLVLFIVIILVIGYYLRLKQLKKSQIKQLRTEIEAQEKERKRLANDLHDDLGTKMSTLKLYMNSMHQMGNDNPAVQKISENAQALLDESISDLRNLLQNLSPQNVVKFGAFKSIQELLLRLERTGLLTVDFSCQVNKQRFHEERELAIYRVVQELVNNTIKHADAGKIELHIMEELDEYVLNYSDDGRGMNPDSAENGNGFGLKSIENRIQIVGGDIVWNDNADAKFSVKIVIPNS